MTVNELSIDELNELRETYYDQLLTTDADVLGDITSASEIPLSNVKQHYEGTYFVKDDFFCNIVDDEQKENAQLELSECLNNKKAYEDIQSIATARFDKHIDNDSMFWNELEEHIIEMIINHEE